MTLQRFAIELETLAMTLEDERAYTERRRAAWLVSRACDEYIEAGPELRRDVDGVLMRHPALRSLFSDEIARSAAALEREAAPRHLRRGLIAAMLAAGQPDPRVWRVQVHELITAAMLPAAVTDGIWTEVIAAASSEVARRLLLREDQARRQSVATSSADGTARTGSGRRRSSEGSASGSDDRSPM